MEFLNTRGESATARTLAGLVDRPLALITWPKYEIDYLAKLYLDCFNFH